MTKLDIYGGLLGAGKTTLIKTMLLCAYRGKKTAVIENEIGRVNLDADEFAGVTVCPLTAGCVCCTLKGDLVRAVRALIRSEAPDYIVMEASGAADLDAIRQLSEAIDEVALNRCVMVVNARKIRKLMTVVGEFYHIQLREASQIYLNFTEDLPREEIIEVRQLLSQLNPDARVIDTPIAELTAGSIPEGMEPSASRRKPVPPASGGAAKGGTRRPPADAPRAQRPTLTVLDPNAPGRILPPHRLARVPELSPSQSVNAPGEGSFGLRKALYTVTIRVPAPLTEQTLDAFRQQLTQSGIWRAKGYVPMKDGTTRKIDYAFGDFFTSLRASDAAPAPCEVVLIGEDQQALCEGDPAERFFGKRAPSN